MALLAVFLLIVAPVQFSKPALASPGAVINEAELYPSTDQTVNMRVFEPDGWFAGLVAYTDVLGKSSTGTITVMTDKAEIKPGETIKITGTIGADLVEGQSVVIQINNPRGDVFKTDSVTPASDGSYSYSLVVGGKYEAMAGRYEVIATYNMMQAKTSFELKGRLGSQTYDLKVGDKIYPIEYEITGGSVNSMSVKVEDKTLVVSIDGTEAGTLTIILPRNVIDSVESGQDIKYIVSMVDLESGRDSQVTAREVETTDDSRILAMDYPQGTDLIEIQGTQVVPEFGVVAALILAVSLVSVIGFARLKER